eukprot:1159761-Pelagomonas_calceolata.AAC.16
MQWNKTQKQHDQIQGSVHRTARAMHLNVKKRKTVWAVRTVPTSIEEKRIPRAEALCFPSTKRTRKKSIGIRRSFESASGASKPTCSTSVLDRSMKLQSELGGCMSVMTKFFKRLKSAGAIGNPAHT